MHRQLAALVAWECDPKNARDYRPYAQELRFGIPGSNLPRLRLADDSGRSFELCGIIDRIDVDSAGRLRVIDYKSGSTTYSKNDILEGRALQSALYARAAEALLQGNPSVIETYYLHIPRREHSGRIVCQGGAASDAVIAEAVTQAARIVEAVRAGNFVAAPSKASLRSGSCAHTCDFGVLCRVTRQGGRKARKAALAFREASLA